MTAIEHVCSNGFTRQHLDDSRRSALSLTAFPCFQQLDRVTQFGRALIEFARDRDFHFPLHDFKLRERTFRADLFEPFFEKGEFGALRRQLWKI